MILSIVVLTGLRRADLARPVGVRRHRRADRRPVRARGLGGRAGDPPRDPAHHPGRARLRRARPSAPAASTSPSSPSASGSSCPRSCSPTPTTSATSLDGGTRIGLVKLFGIEVDASNHPHAWAAVSLVCFVLLALLVANLRRSRTGRRLLAVRTNERAAASLGISVFGVKLYAFAVSAGLAAVAGILVGFRGQVDHLHRVQRVRLDQQPRPRGDRRPRLRARRGLRRAQRHRRLRHPHRGGLGRASRTGGT